MINKLIQRAAGHLLHRTDIVRKPRVSILRRSAFARFLKRDAKPFAVVILFQNPHDTVLEITKLAACLRR